ncbi:MAG: nucleotidyltransferase domain-containing protein [Campylobacterales bacterium]|nr:nucleotidyltransferase domain-containing protein [Campylobacterales bacterium]
MSKKEDIIAIVKSLNSKHQPSGFKIVSLFGSYARGCEDIFSDVDLTYSINHEIFYKDDAFAKLEKIESIKKELEKELHLKVDLISSNTKNKLILETLKKEQIFL